MTTNYNYTMITNQTDYAALLDDLETLFERDIESVSDLFVGYDEDDNPIYDEEYTLQEREQMRQNMVDRLVELERELEGEIEDKYSQLSDLQSLLETVDSFEVDSIFS